MEDIKVERPGRIKARGPLKDLELNKYKSNDRLQYPLNLSDDREYKHYIIFNINIPEKSTYSKQLKQTGTTGIADYNRVGGSQISSSQDPFSKELSAAAGTITGVIKGFEAFASAVSGKGSVGGALAGIGLNTAIVGTTLAFVDMQRKTKRLAQSIFLYVPDTVQQTTTNKWSGVSMTEALGTAGLAAQGMQGMGEAEFNSILKPGGLDAKLGAGRTAEASASGGLIGELAGKAAAASGGYGSGIERVMMASAGYAQNPQIEILFDSVDNRTFQFDFKFTPKSQAEAIAVLDIIKAFRFHAAPEIVQGPGGGRFFIPPSEFDISYHFEGSPNKALHKFSTCVLEAIDVNYSNGNFATYDDGVPVEIGMTLRFMEVEILHKKLIAEGY